MSRPKTESELAAERRRDERRDASETPELSARLVGGASVRLLNVSARGVLLETTMALPPGRSISLRFLALDAELVLSGCVVRSCVGSLTSNSVSYCTAVSLGQENTLYTQLVDAKSAALPETDDMTLVVSVAQNAHGVRSMMIAGA